MGLDYSINLYFPLEKTEQVLLATAAIAYETDREIELTLPDGKTLSLPFTSHFISDPVRLEPLSSVRLDTGLSFPFDLAIEQYKHGNPHAEPSTQTVYSYLGYIYLTVRLGSRFVEFSFMAATSGMSRLFATNATIQGQFLELLRAHAGIIGIVDIEEYTTFLLLDNPALRLSYLDESIPFPERLHPEDTRIDHFVDDLIAMRAALNTNAN